MKTFMLLVGLIMALLNTQAQEIRTGIRVLQGIAIGDKWDTGDTGLAFSIGYDHQLFDKWQVYGALETGGNSAFGTFFLADFGVRYDLFTANAFRVALRGGILPGMMGYREEPPLLFGSSFGVDLQRTSGSWQWYVSPGIRRLQPYHPRIDFTNLTDVEIRFGAAWPINGRKKD